jgi:hypothetical protein
MGNDHLPCPLGGSSGLDPNAISLTSQSAFREERMGRNSPVSRNEIAERIQLRAENIVQLEVLH